MTTRNFTTRAMPLRRAHRRTGGFSLMEVLVALGIFTIGLVAVAAIFPAAITIQRDTVREVDGRRIGKNAKAVLLAVARNQVPSGPNDDKPEYELSLDTSTGVPYDGSLGKFLDNAFAASAFNPTPVYPMIDLPEPPIPGFQGTGAALDAPTSFHGLIPLRVRSFPQSIGDPSRRDYYWYPLIQIRNATTAPSIAAFIIVMRRDGTDQPPQVRESFDLNPTQTTGNEIVFGPQGLFNDGTGPVNNDPDNDGLPDFIQAGDRVLGNDGLIHRVVLAEANKLTVDSPNIGNLTRIFFTVNIDATGAIKRESRSPLVWIEDGIDLSINP